MNFNKAIVLGNLTRDPETRSLPSGQSVTSFGLATNRIYNDKNGQRQKQAEFHNIVIFGKMAETAAKYLKKGSMVLIEGRIQTRTWEDQSGNKKWKTEIVANNMQLGPRSNFAGSAPATVPPPDEDLQSQPKEENIPVIEEDGDEEEIDVKDIPF